MKPLSIVISIAGILLVLWSCTKEQDDIILDKAYKDEINQARKAIALHMRSNYIPGANFAIAKGNEIIYSDALGYASIKLDVPMRRDIKLRIGDVSELFTSIMYLKMVENGMIHPDSTVQYYMKDYPCTDNRLALKHLAYHTSGIRMEEPVENDWDGAGAGLQKGLEQFKNDPLISIPGYFEEVSMFNTNLLGAVMEKASGKRFSRLLEEYITDTLHLSNTRVDDPFSLIKGKSDFYDNNLMGQIKNAPFRDLRYKAPSKGMLSNAEDLVKLGMAILESDYFDAAFKHQLFEPCELFGKYRSKMAHGWILTSDDQGRDVNARIGGVVGGGAAILLYPNEKLVVAYVQNKTPDKKHLPIMEIADFFLQNTEK